MLCVLPARHDGFCCDGCRLSLHGMPGWERTGRYLWDNPGTMGATNPPGPRHALAREALASAMLDTETHCLETEPQGAPQKPEHVVEEHVVTVAIAPSGQMVATEDSRPSLIRVHGEAVEGALVVTLADEAEYGRDH